MNTVGGQLRQLTFNSHWDRLASWSADGQWILYSSDVRDDATFDIYKIRPDGTDNQLVFSNGNRNSHARFSPDQSFITFTTGDGVRDARTWEIGVLDLRTEPPRLTLLTDNEHRDASPTFDDSGETILYTTWTGESITGIATMGRDGSNPQVIYDSDDEDWSASYSLDGDFLVVTSTVNGTDQLFIVSADGTSAQQITTNGGAYASWIPRVGE